MSHIIAMAIIAEVTTITDVMQDAHVDNYPLQARTPIRALYTYRRIYTLTVATF
jgi:hypothetical protein